MPWLTAGGAGAAGPDGLVVPIELAMLWALLELTCLPVLASREFCLPIGLAMREDSVNLVLVFALAAGAVASRGSGAFVLPIELPRRNVLAGLIWVLRRVEADFEVLAGFVFPTPIIRPIPEVLVELAPLGCAAVDADSPFPVMGLAMLRIWPGLARLLDGADRELPSDGADALF